MVKIARGGRKPGTPQGGRGSGKKAPGGKAPAPGGGGPGPLKTSKGTFSFTMVADGCYIEHKVRTPCCLYERHEAATPLFSFLAATLLSHEAA